MKLAGAAILLLLVAAPASALSFLEDFESYSIVGPSPEEDPAQDWYTYRDANDVAILSADDPAMSDSAWLRLQAVGGDPGSNGASFSLAAPTQLTNISFEIRGVTIADNTNGSRQVVSIESSAPRRTMVEFFVFCTDEAAPSACELRVRFDTIDTTGQVLVNTTVGDTQFNITVIPDWTVGEYQLFVNGVDDGVFPFLELPSDVGRLTIRQASTSYHLNASFDNLFIDGAALPAADVGDDIATFFQDFADDINFTTSASKFLLGLWFFVVVLFAVGVPMVVLGNDNTTYPTLAFLGTLTSLFLVYIEWWPEWIGITEIIAVAAIIGIVIRRFVMGIRDASTNAAMVAGSLGYFIIATSLLGFSGYATDSVTIPTDVLTTDQDENVTATTQSFSGAVTECLITFFSDCSRDTTSQTWAVITDVASTIFNFARTAFTFLFQLLTFSLPIQPIFNVMIILPPASSLATVGFGFITRSGS